MKKISILFLILLVGCAAPTTKQVKINPVLAEIEAKKQRELVLREMVVANKRLSEISYRVLTGAVTLCPKKKHKRLGLHLWNMYSWKNEWRDTAVGIFEVSNVVQVSFAVPDSPAAKAGFREGDVLTSIGDWPLPVGEKGIEKVSDKLRELLKEKTESLSIGIIRDEKQHTLSVDAVDSCDYPVLLDPDDAVNAFADGEKLHITRGMMRFIRDDNELALVLSHELAHNTMGHIDAKKQNAMAGAVGGFLIDILFAGLGANTGGKFADIGAQAGANAYSVEFEQEADYVGMYAMALSNFKLEEAPNFWRRMATQSPESIKFKSTHPTTPERFLALEATVKEIRAKQVSGQPLQPDMKEPAKKQPPEGTNKSK
ncbi:MAG: M48 family metalloprotease [Proteobacteria bacterium]|nr:M48 family metalloprotease [Pseudomonadota bacterium]